MKDTYTYDEILEVVYENAFTDDENSQLIFVEDLLCGLRGLKQ